MYMRPYQRKGRPGIIFGFSHAGNWVARKLVARKLVAKKFMA
jgi:hypothetical protein